MSRFSYSFFQHLLLTNKLTKLHMFGSSGVLAIACERDMKFLPWLHHVRIKNNTTRLWYHSKHMEIGDWVVKGYVTWVLGLCRRGVNSIPVEGIAFFLIYQRRQSDDSCPHERCYLFTWEYLNKLQLARFLLFMSLL